MKSPYKDEEQTKAINHGEGPALICAGPGSGKTYVITNRILNLIQKRHIPPEKILVITFTKSAATEMKDRFLSLSHLESTDILFGTFHSVYLGFIKYFSPNSIPGIVESHTQNKIIKKILGHSSIYTQNVYFSMDKTEDLLSAISYYKSSDFNVPTEYPQDLFLRFYNEYSECLQAGDYMDYDDILLRCRELLEGNPGYCNVLKNRFDYILIDEFQDINKLQYSILKKIINDSQNIFVVGDDDQSIYGFRGATPGIMRDFLEDFPTALKIDLKTNYRSATAIVEAADKLISHNLSRINRSSHVSFNRSDEGDFSVKIFNSKEEEYEYIKKLYFDEVNRGQETTILTRTNKDVFALREYFGSGFFTDNNISIPKNLRYEINEDILSYLSFCDKSDRASLMNILNKPKRYLTRNILVEPVVNLDCLINKYKGTYKGESLEILKRNIDVLKKISPFAFITYLFNICGYKDYILEKYPSSQKETIEILNDITEISKKISERREFHTALTCSNPALSREEKTKIMTFHSSKGLEFDTVILPDVNEGKIPGRVSLKSGDTEEERRLFYVAMTRARKKLLITCVKGVGSMRMLPSRFITEFLNK